MQQQPSVIATGDFLYFAPAGKAFTVPADGVVSTSAKPGAADAIWTTYALGTVAGPTADKIDAKDIVIKQPMPGTGHIVNQTVLRPSRSMSTDVEMNEMSRLALAGFYKSPLIELADDSFTPLAGNSLQGWLKRQRYDQLNGLWIVDDWFVDLNVTDLGKKEDNLLSPKFTFTWLYSPLAGSAI